jgi:hypothetical protein
VPVRRAQLKSFEFDLEQTGSDGHEALGRSFDALDQPGRQKVFKRIYWTEAEKNRGAAAKDCKYSRGWTGVRFNGFLTQVVLLLAVDIRRSGGGLAAK